MHTFTTGRAETRSISIAAPPEAVLGVVADGGRLPEWAPAFARAARRDGDGWLVDGGAAEFRIRLRVARELGTVDILRPADPPSGAFLRVLPNEQGSELLFTLLFPGATPEEAVAGQMATVETELEAVRALSEAAAGAWGRLRSPRAPG
ncbi:SRPBCC family protein [Baekduia soli]|uniref:SRPBCC family protein n=1 Tax=Baekduia soli TaxID=496014 RepID=A0A5B8U8Q1_9ACTN|nr:SRPBCC family protein [Baekduia soli]QEC49519.1 SRPBCC family protein [Baekduia soli]